MMLEARGAMTRWMRAGTAAAMLFGSEPAPLQAQVRTQAARPMRTEADARARVLQLRHHVLQEIRRRAWHPVTRNGRQSDHRCGGEPEFAHAIHSAVLDVDSMMAREITASYDAAMAAGEYWAEGVQWCFSGNIQVETPEEFGAYDPPLFALISRIFKTHRIEADVFHAKRIRPVTCSPA